MSKLAYGDIIRILVEEGIEVSTFIASSRSEGRLPASLGRVKTVKTTNFDDYEESGRYDEDTHVTHFVEHDVYISTTVRLDSYGSNPSYPYGYGKEVRPVVKPTTVYE
jgi:hypothetical protein